MEYIPAKAGKEIILAEKRKKAYIVYSNLTIRQIKRQSLEQQWIGSYGR